LARLKFRREGDAASRASSSSSDRFETNIAEREYIPPALFGLVAALTYFVACKAGLTLATANPNATAVWPGSGIAFASFMLFGYGIWPAIF
jgi:integral membrane sensor domain MASE1